MPKGWTYSKAGVNIDDKSKAISSLVGELRFRREGVGQMVRIPDLFASLIDFGDKYLTMATDGVGSKLLIAKELGIWDTVGIDCIAMNVNDTICVNAEPISFVDYIAIDRPDDTVTKEIGIGLQKGAEMSGMEIVGGEIAVLPEIVNCLDLSGTCLGFVDKARAITGEKCEEGDVILGIRSSGMHSNGFTLARKVLESSNVSLNDKVKGLSGKIGAELLTPTEIYVKQVLDITRDHEVHGLADITGGGLRNICRMKKGLRYVISDPIAPAPIFNVIRELGDVEDREMYQTFNMSMGFTMILPESDANDVVKRYKNTEIVGRVEKGSGVLLEPCGILYERY
ncbi:MAG: phosphoribosylformylglycinamidine cyclo-ligase [Candidatus Methanoplasma sp.]|jgi:phosphoribosylformylglycinamidine cyclo-ligase|nr:phosphoribosylformylglycinamidine cyclo-ligase [Candidatus Methanoplasma sp.]